MNRSVVKDDARCDVRAVNEDAVAEVRDARAADHHLAHLAETFQVLASTTRLRLVEALARQEFCVCDLAALVEVSESAVSHHLRQMRELRIVRYRKEGRMAYYRLDDGHVADLFRLGLDHVRE